MTLAATLLRASALGAALALASAACAPELVWSGHSADRAHAIEIRAHAHRQWVVIDGERRAAQDGIAAWSMATTADRLVYAARRADRWHVITEPFHGDLRSVGPDFAGIGAIAAAPGHLAYAAQRGDHWLVIADGVAGPPADSLLADTLQFSGDLVVYAADLDGSARVIVGGIPQAAFAAVGELVTAAGHVAYAGRADDGWHVVRDGVVGTTAYPRAPHLRSSPDGAHLAWLSHASDDRIECAAWPTIDARTARPPHDATPHDAAPHDAAPHDAAPLAARTNIGEIKPPPGGAAPTSAAWAARDVAADIGEINLPPSGAARPPSNGAPRDAAPHDGAPLAARANIGEIRPPPGGAAPTSAAWAARAAAAPHDGAPLAARANIGEIKLPPSDAVPRSAAWAARDVAADIGEIKLGGEVVATAGAGAIEDFAALGGCRVAYVERRSGGERFVVMSTGAASGPFAKVGALATDGRGERFGFTAERGGKSVVVIDGKEQPGDGAPVFSADGARVAYLRRDGAKVAAIVDGTAYPFDLAIDGTLAFSPDGSAWAVLAGELRTEKLFFAVDGTHRVPLTETEMVSAAAANDPAAIRRWAEAEATRVAAAEATRVAAAKVAAAKATRAARR
ncbi:MAG TPA: hypothetical protein VGM88_30170 [Kofleriaceae bacterium]